MRKSWGFRGKDGWNIGTSLERYCCQQVIDKITKYQHISDTLKFRHHHLTQPTLTPEDCVIHSMQTLQYVLEYAPTAVCDAQLKAIAALRNGFQLWATPMSPHTKEQPPTKMCPDLKALPRLTTPNAPTCSPVKYGQPPLQLHPRQLQGCASSRRSIPQFQGWGYNPSVYLRTLNPFHSARVHTPMSGRKILPQTTSPFPTKRTRARPTV